MVKFQIQPNSDIPIATQLYDQLSFAITSGQYAPGTQLPSTRQLALWTGAHRNTVSKVYQQLKDAGLVESQAGAGVFVKPQGDMPSLGELHQLARQAIDRFVRSGYGLEQIKQTLMEELNWRLRCAALLWVACHAHDPGAGEIMANQIRQSLSVPLQVVTIEDLPYLLDQENSATTIVTNPYLYEATKQAVQGFSIPVIPLQIYHYQQEMERVQRLPPNSYVGIVASSSGILRVAENIIRSAKGDDIILLSCMPQQREELHNLTRFAHVLFVADSPELVKEAIRATQPQRIRPLEVIYCQSYIARESLERLKLELGIV
jgi:GntR family transcriptional regulator